MPVFRHVMMMLRPIQTFTIQQKLPNPDELCNWRKNLRDKPCECVLRKIDDVNVEFRPRVVLRLHVHRVIVMQEVEWKRQDVAGPPVFKIERRRIADCTNIEDADIIRKLVYQVLETRITHKCNFTSGVSKERIA